MLHDKYIFEMFHIVNNYFAPVEEKLLLSYDKSLSVYEKLRKHVKIDVFVSFSMKLKNNL